MTKFSAGLIVVLTIFVTVSCTSGPEFVLNRYGDTDGKSDVDSNPVSKGDSDTSPGCAHECVSDETLCSDQGGTLHEEMSCPDDELCCEIDKGPQDTGNGPQDTGNGPQDTGEPVDNTCTYNCMASWLCQLRGTPHPDMSCQGNNVCCEVRGGNPGDNPDGEDPDPTPEPTCEFDCVNSFMCNFIGEEHPEMTCAGNNVCCERNGDSPGGPGSDDPSDNGCDFECVRFFECRGEGAIRHDEMSCGQYQICCEFDDNNPGNGDDDPNDPAQPCAYNCVRPSRCESRGGTEFPKMTCDGDRVCCRF